MDDSANTDWIGFHLVGDFVQPSWSWADGTSNNFTNWGQSKFLFTTIRKEFAKLKKFTAQIIIGNPKVRIS